MTTMNSGILGYLDLSGGVLNFCYCERKLRLSTNLLIFATLAKNTYMSSSHLIKLIIL